MLAGLEVADGGSIIVDGFDISSANPRETARFRLNKVGFVFQFFNLLPTLTLLQNVALPSLLAGKGRSKSHTRARELLARVALKSEAGRLPEEVSGGQCQRAAIARALINEPELILADEPTGNLDLNTARSILELFSWVREVSSPTIIIATHDREVASIADRTLTLREGKLG
jgi:putative ABC transport system ATP-binding protein